MQINKQVAHINQQITAFQTDMSNRLGALQYELNQLVGGNVSSPRTDAGTGDRPAKRAARKRNR